MSFFNQLKLPPENKIKLSNVSQNSDNQSELLTYFLQTKIANKYKDELENKYG